MTTLELSIGASSRAARAAKSILDWLLAFWLLVLLSPLWLLIALWIKLDSPGPVIFRQPRLGQDGRIFPLLKFRTMVPTAEQELEEVLQGSPQARLSWEQYQKLRQDPRLTRCGRILRRFSLDEIPQLWNVLRGEMSLVGPRPILPRQRELYGAPFSVYCQVKPGMTGLWQVNGRSRTSFSERVDWDAAYLQNWSLRLDLHILLRTIGVVLRGDGAL
ncbi:MAG: exopolysaccharide biosynthesis protein [Chloroflexi bacterium]|jgi:exopolysaccharide production protein ExoY|nr:exopolysaccharide biosynthesis protein [Chloroflexota bacterium]